MIPLAELREHLADPPIEDNALIERLEAAAVAYLQRATGRFLGPPTPRVEWVRVAGYKELWLADEPQAPITVTIDGVVEPAANYEVRGRRLVHDFGWGVWRVPTEVRVDYTAGYTAGTEPADVRQLVRMIVAHLYETGSLSVTDQTVQEVPGAADMLNRLRRLV